MLVVIALVTVISLVLTNSIATFYKQNAYTLAQSYQLMYARAGIKSLTRDMREMTASESGGFPLVTMQSYKVAFYSDIDHDDAVEYVEYELVGSDFYKRIYNPTVMSGALVYDLSSPTEERTVSRYVQNRIDGTVMFRYYDGSGTEVTATSSITNVTYITADVVVNVDPIRDPGQYMLHTGAFLRNSQ